MPKVRSVAATVLVAALTCAGVNAQGSFVEARGTGPQQRLVDADRDFLKTAAALGLAELRASELALRHARAPEVRTFARHMVEAHTPVNDRLQHLAAERGVALPREAPVLMRDKLRLLEAAIGPDFDWQYMEEFGIETHRAALRQYRIGVSQSTDPELRSVARQTIPTLEQHLTLAEGVVGRLRRPEPDPAAAAASPVGAEVAEARQELDEALQVVQRMKSDPQATEQLQNAKGVFILTSYGRAALGLGVQGGEGVLLVRQRQGFSNPIFYDMAGLSLGAQAGASGGEIALLLMTDKAVEAFKSRDKFSLNADAGLTFADFSRRSHESVGKLQDVMVWSGTKGVYAGVSAGLTDVFFDSQANRAFYARKDLDARQILEGKVPHPGNNVLGLVLGV